ncbi:hypothetical protein H257_04004 [Aphanomyces astaci]|nr:hypothetical protein H257_04004 [Aphanomyces astaci]ETV83223.1 hypothetical protein H257_04004 [Aphanomyces astaci]|eukprot:XP_009826653.1 hypothetical protein H257_04004 [Aphanomyces astaci]
MLHHTRRPFTSCIRRTYARQSSSTSQAYPSAPSPWSDTAHSIVQNCTKMLTTLKQCRHHTSPVLSFQHKLQVFGELHQVDDHVDLDEFMTGADAAVDVVLHATYSEGFRAFCMDGTMCPDVEVLQRVLAVDCFNKCVLQVQEADKRGMLYDLRHLHIRHRSLLNADTHQRQHARNFDSRNDGLVRLDVHVVVDRTMRISSRWKDFVIKTPVSMLWSFECDVNANDVQWHIVAFDDLELSKYKKK